MHSRVHAQGLRQLDHLHPRMVTRCSRQATIARNQQRIQSFGKCDISRIIGGEIVPQFPDARQQQIVRISLQREIGKVSEGHTPALIVDFATRRVAADHLRHFNVKQMWRMQSVPRVKQPPFHNGCRRRA